MFKHPLRLVAPVVVIIVIGASLYFSVTEAIYTKNDRRAGIEAKQQLASYHSAHQRSCSLLRTRLQGAALEVRQVGATPGFAPGFDYPFVAAAFYEVIVFADGCVRLPPATQKIADLTQLNGPAPSVLAIGVLALADAFDQQAANGWPLPPSKNTR